MAEKAGRSGRRKSLRRKLSAASACFFGVSFLWLLGLAAPALGAMGRDDFFALVESGDIAEIEAAIQGGQDLEQENEVGWTPLFIAVKRGDPDVVRLLLRASANPGHRANGDMTALHCAMFGPTKGCPLEKTLEIVNLLLLEDMSLANARNCDGMTPLHIAALIYSEREIRNQIRQRDMKDIPRLLEVLLSAGTDPNIKDKKGNTALHDAVLGSDDEVALLLIQSGADVSASDNEGATPIYLAAAMGQSRVVSALLAHGASPDVGMEGVTPLHVATGIILTDQRPSGEWESFSEMLTRTGRNGADFLKVAKALVEAGAEVNALSSQGKKRTPLDMAEMCGNTMVAEYLKSVGGERGKPWYWPF